MGGVLAKFGINGVAYPSSPYWRNWLGMGTWGTGSDREEVGDPQRNSEMDALIAENLRLNEILERAKLVFKKDWDSRFTAYEKMEMELAELIKEEQELTLTICELKTEAGMAGRSTHSKEEELRVLNRRLLKLSGLNAKPIGSQHDEQPDVGAARRKLADAIFPAEVWEVILGNVSDPTDLWNCCNTCNLFEAFLRPWKVGWMLEQALPQLCKHLPRNMVYKCRMVCRSWNGAVDRLLEDPPARRPHDITIESRFADKVLPWVRDVRNLYDCSFQENDGLKLYRTRYDRSREFPLSVDRNPIIGREVYLFMWDWDEDEELDGEQQAELEREQRAELEEWWSRFFKYLEVYGKHIWSINLYLPCLESVWNGERVVELLNFRLFQLLPQLRWLNVGCSDIKFPILHLEQVLLPPAPKLETITFSGIHHPPSHRLLIRALTNRYHLQLRKLQMQVNMWRTVSHLNWPSLTELLLDDVDCESELDGEMMPFSLTRIGLSLRMSYRSGRNPGQIPFQSLLDFLAVLSATTCLSAVRLGGIDAIQFGNSELVPQASSSVKTLELIVAWSAPLPSCCGLVISGFPLIEKVHVCISSGYKQEFTFASPDYYLRNDTITKSKDAVEMLEVIKFVYTGEMYESNIWDVLPRLKVFTFQWDEYTRQGYEAYCKSKLTIS